MDEIIKAGRPFKFTDPNDLRMQIQAYFDMCDPHIETQIVENGYRDDGQMIIANRQVFTKQVAYSVADLARHLGVSRTTLREYRKPSHYSEEIPAEIQQELMTTIEDAHQKIEGFAERQLYTPYANGAKFNLTNNFGWVDKSVVDTRDVTGDLDEIDDQEKAAQGREEAAAEAQKLMDEARENAGPEA